MKNEPKKPEIIYGWPLYSSIVGNEWPLKLSLHDSQYVYFYLAKLKTKTKVFFSNKNDSNYTLISANFISLESSFAKSKVMNLNFKLFFPLLILYVLKIQWCKEPVLYCNSLKTSFFRMPVWLENTIVDFYIQAYGFKMNEF